MFLPLKRILSEIKGRLGEICLLRKPWLSGGCCQESEGGRIAGGNVPSFLILDHQAL